MTPHDALARLIESELDRPAPPDAKLFVDRLIARHRDSVRAILFYGACRRSGQADGVLDFYVIVDSYRTLHKSSIGAFANWLLPPTVVFDQVEDGGPAGPAAKIAFVSKASFLNRMQTRSIDTSFWARFSQPVSLLYTADPNVRRDVITALSAACRTAVTRARSVAPEARSSRELWAGLFSFTYATELRPERQDRPDIIYDRDQGWYDGMLDALSVDLHRPGESGRIDGAVRIAAGKCLSFFRLAKGAFTFDGGVDYVIWKIERHNGAKVELTPWQRKHPVLASPLILFKLFRMGAIR